MYSYIAPALMPSSIRTRPGVRSLWSLALAAYSDYASYYLSLVTPANHRPSEHKPRKAPPPKARTCPRPDPSRQRPSLQRHRSLQETQPLHTPIRASPGMEQLIPNSLRCSPQPIPQSAKDSKI